jgi:hypothetical protein
MAQPSHFRNGERGWWSETDCRLPPLPGVDTGRWKSGGMRCAFPPYGD